MTAASARRPEPVDAAPEFPLTISEGGEIVLHLPSPNRVWALSAFAELVDLGPVSHFRLVEDAVVQALSAGVQQSQIISFLQRTSGDRLPATVRERIAAWSRALQRADIQSAFVVRVKSPRAASSLLKALQNGAWSVQFLDEQTLLVLSGQGHQSDDEGIRLQEVIRAAGHLPHWPSDAESAEDLAPYELRPDPELETDAERL